MTRHTSADFDVLDYALSMHDPGEYVSINDLREPLVIAQIPPSSYGGLLAAAVKHGLIERIDYTTAKHKAAKGHPVRVYRILGHRHDRPRNVHPAAAA